jgi:hypothetical protein
MANPMRKLSLVPSREAPSKRALRNSVNAHLSAVGQEMFEAVWANAQEKKRKFCLAFLMSRSAPGQCKIVIPVETPTGKKSRIDHQFCCQACYSRVHRLPGFVRRALARR